MRSLSLKNLPETGTEFFPWCRHWLTCQLSYGCSFFVTIPITIGIIALPRMFSDLLRTVPSKRKNRADLGLSKRTNWSSCLPCANERFIKVTKLWLYISRSNLVGWFIPWVLLGFVKNWSKSHVHFDINRLLLYFDHPKGTLKYRPCSKRFHRLQETLEQKIPQTCLKPTETLAG